MPKVTFNSRNSAFYGDLKKSVEEYFVRNNLKKTGNWRLYIKTLTLVPVAIFIYCFLLLTDVSAGFGIALC